MSLDYLSTWCDIVGGEQLDGIESENLRDDAGQVLFSRFRPNPVRGGHDTDRQHGRISVPAPRGVGVRVSPPVQML